MKESIDKYLSLPEQSLEKNIPEIDFKPTEEEAEWDPRLAKPKTDEANQES